MAVSSKNKTEIYGSVWRTTDLAAIELECIKRGGHWEINGKRCGMGLEHHIVAFAKIVWPWIFWHRWNKDLILPEIVKNRCQVAIYGPSSSGKSSTLALYVLVMYYAFPNNTTVLVSSTTRDALELRIWGEIKMLHKEAKQKLDWLPGNLTDSKQLISTDGKDVEGRDFRNGMIGRPCKRGSEWVGLGDYVGIKNENMYVVADESQLMPDGFLKSIANLRSNKQCRTYVLGNLNDLGTPLGQAAEPEHGWDSLPDTDVSRAYNTRWCDGRAIQLIGMDSPQLDFPVGAEPFGPLIGRQYIEQCAQDYGRDTPLFNMFASGKIPRGTLENRVISKQICLKFNAFEEVSWGHDPLTKLYGMDVSYTAEHGDRTVGIPMAYGKDTEGKLRLACLERPLIFSPSDRATGTIEEQLASQLLAECKRLDIPPTHVFYDGTGRSSFTAAVMRLWSTSVNPIEFGGTATNRPNFIGRRYQEDDGYKRNKGDLLPCDQVFGKMVSELWFALRYLIEADQCRQLSEEVAKEAYLRLWKLTSGNKMDVEPKKDLKLRLGRSCDLADALVCGIEGARRLGFALGNLGGEQKRRSVWLRQLNAEFKELQKSTELDI